MKLLAIIGSPRGMHGNTGQVLEAVLRGAREAGAEVVVRSLSELTINPCVACDACHRTGICAQKDDFRALWAAMREADMLVLASPNYIVSVSAQLKALFDRCCGPVHLMALEGKYAAAVVTAGGGGCEEVETYIQRFARSLGCRTVGSIGVEAGELMDKEAAAAALKRAEELGGRLVAAARGKETMAEQEPERAAHAERMKLLITAMREHWPYEYDYLQQAGRL